MIVDQAEEIRGLNKALATLRGGQKGMKTKYKRLGAEDYKKVSNSNRSRIASITSHLLFAGIQCLHRRKIYVDPERHWSKQECPW